MKNRLFQFLYMNMNSPTSLPGDFPVYVMNRAITDIDVLVSSFFSFSQDINAKLLPLVIIGSVRIGNFESADFPE